MLTKVVYVLTSDVSDTYLEQALVSLYSLRLYNKEAIVVLVCDDITEQGLSGNRSAVLEYIDEKIIVKPPLDMPKMLRSRYIKTSLRRYVKGNYLFIDTDTIICSPRGEIDEQKGEIAAVLDFHLYTNEYNCFLSTWRFHERMKKIHNWNSELYNKYFNSGVLFVRDTEITHEFYRIWHEQWLLSVKSGIYTDQQSMARTNMICGNIIEEMNGIWNCQVLFTGIRYLHDAYIIHYFSSSKIKKTGEKPYYFSNTRVFSDIKREGCISDDLKYLILNAKSAFPRQIHIYAGEYLNLLSSSSFMILQKMFFEYRKFFEIFNGVIDCVRISRLNIKYVLSDSLKHLNLLRGRSF